jgi:hypothetical protein
MIEDKGSKKRTADLNTAREMIEDKGSKKRTADLNAAREMIENEESQKRTDDFYSAFVPAQSSARYRPSWHIDLPRAPTPLSFWDQTSYSTLEDYQKAIQECVKAKYGFHTMLDRPLYVLYIEIEAPKKDEEKATDSWRHSLPLNVSAGLYL